MINRGTAGILRLKYVFLGEHRKILPLLNRAQAAKPLLAPLNFATPFPIIRYRKKAGYGEWCCFFSEYSLFFGIDREKKRIFSVLNKNITAFLVNIRGPPSEV